MNRKDAKTELITIILQSILFFIILGIIAYGAALIVANS